MVSREDVDMRLQSLEEKFEYQDRTIDALNEVIIAQQNQLALITEELERLKTMLRTLEDTPAGGFNEPPPPHY